MRPNTLAIVGSLLLLLAGVGCKEPRSHVTAVVPEDGASLEAPPASVTVEFDRPMDPATITSDTLRVSAVGGGSLVAGITYDTSAQRATVALVPVEPGTEVEISASSAIRSTSKKRLRPFHARFAVRAPEITPPTPFTLESTTPTPESPALPRIATLRAQYSSPYNPFTATTSTVHLVGSRSGAHAVQFPNPLGGGGELAVQSDRPFLAGERITLALGGLTSLEGSRAADAVVRFHVSSVGTVDTLPHAAGAAGAGAQLAFLDADGDGADEWLVVHSSGLVECFDDSGSGVIAVGSWSLSGPATDLACGDFDADGDVDAVLLLATGNRLELLAGEPGAPTLFSPPAAIPLSGAAARGLVPAVLDGSGRVDLLLLPTDPADDLTMRRGDPASPLALAEPLGVLDVAGPLTVADFDGDHLPDLAYVDGAGEIVVAWGGDPAADAGEIAPWAATTLLSPISTVADLTAADFDGDGVAELVAAAVAGAAGTQFALVGDPQLRDLAGAALPSGAASAGVQVVDLDADGAIDLLSPGPGASLTWSPGVGDGSILAGQDFASASPATLVRIGDFDGDEILDLGLVDATGAWEVRRGVGAAPGVTNRMWIADQSLVAGARSAPVDIAADSNLDLDGFTAVLGFDPAIFTAVRLGTAGTDAGALSPELELPTIAADHVVLAAVFDFLPPYDGVALAAGTGLTLVRVDFDVDVGAPAGAAALALADGLGTPPKDNVFVVGGITVPPLVESGVVSITTAGPAPAGTFLRGDANLDGAVDIADVNFLQEHLVRGGVVPPCLDAADANDDGAVDSLDVTALLDFLLASGSPPPRPFPTPGTDPTRDALDCATPLAPAF